MELIIPHSLKGERLDVALVKVLQAPSRQWVKNEFDLGNIRIENIFKLASKAKGGEKITVIKQDVKPFFIVPQKMDLAILFEDEYLLVINKPKGLTVHPGAGNSEYTLLNGIVDYCPQILEQQSERPGIVHRIDKDTSGAILVAKTSDVLVALSSQFLHRKVFKEYVLICHGVFGENSFTLNTGHMRSPYNRLKFLTNFSAPISTRSKIRNAVSDYFVVKNNLKENVSYLKAHIHTGRTHQIRAQLADIGHPLLGDKLYGSKFHDIKGQALHAYNLKFTHPKSGNIIDVKAPMPKEFENLVNKFFNETN